MYKYWRASRGPYGVSWCTVPGNSVSYNSKHSKSELLVTYKGDVGVVVQEPADFVKFLLKVVDPHVFDPTSCILLLIKLV